MGSKDELFRAFEASFRRVGRLHSMVQRNGDRVTSGNIELEVLAPEISAEEITSLLGRKAARPFPVKSASEGGAQHAPVSLNRSGVVLCLN
jgi:hypothetical protein